MKPLTYMQQRVYDTIASHIREKGFPPTLREIGDAVGLSSKSTVAAHLAVLEQKGWIRRDPASSRALVLVDDPMQRLIEGAEQMARYEDDVDLDRVPGWAQVRAALADLDSAVVTKPAEVAPGNLARWARGLLRWLMRDEGTCEDTGCDKAAVWHDPALDLRTCDEHVGGGE